MKDSTLFNQTLAEAGAEWPLLTLNERFGFAEENRKVRRQQLKDNAKEAGLDARQVFVELQQFDNTAGGTNELLEFVNTLAGQRKIIAASLAKIPEGGKADDLTLDNDALFRVAAQLVGLKLKSPADPMADAGGLAMPPEGDEPNPTMTPPPNPKAQCYGD